MITLTRIIILNCSCISRFRNQKNTETQNLTIGKDPSGLAATSLFLVGIICGEKRTQQSIAKPAHATEVTIRHRHKDLLSSLSPSVSMKEFE